MAKKPSQHQTEKHHRKKTNQDRSKKLDGPNRPST